MGRSRPLFLLLINETRASSPLINAPLSCSTCLQGKNKHLTCMVTTSSGNSMKSVTYNEIAIDKTFISFGKYIQTSYNNNL